MLLSILRVGGQAVVYAGMALWLGYFANEPVYTHFDPGMALIKLNVIHSPKRKGECRRRTAEELKSMNPNMRRPFDCPRERLPIHIELLVDGKTVYSETLEPAGLIAHGGQARAYRRIPVQPGEHELLARMIDSTRTSGYDYQKSARIDLAPEENFVVDFRAEMGGFIFNGNPPAASPGS